MTILCLASYEKGYEFLREAKQQGARVLLLTSQSLQHASWPRESLDEIFFMPDDDHKWNLTDTVHAVSYLARREDIAAIVPLDDFDLETAALLREHLRLPGMGESQTRFFRDKLAMRMQAAAHRLPVPDFTPLFPDHSITSFMERVPGPWVLKPRLMAGAIGIKRIHHANDFWPIAESLGDRRSFYLLERFVPGDIFHVDSIVADGHVICAIASGYGRPPLEVSHEGGIFTTRLLERGSDVEQGLLELNRHVLRAMGHTRGVSHTEFIRAHDGQLYFLETSARVGGAHISDLLESATGINMWAEWAKLEVNETYTPPRPRHDYGALIVSLARQEYPDTSAYNDPEVVWRMNKRHHAGLVITSPDRNRVEDLLGQYTYRFAADFHAALPPRDTASH